jgi:hypothetical protein
MSGSIASASRVRLDSATFMPSTSIVCLPRIERPAKGEVERAPIHGTCAPLRLD